MFFIEIIEPPENQTAFINQSAEFQCEVDGGHTDWRLNGTFLGSLSPEIHDDLTTYSSVSNDGYTLLRLVIVSRAIYNESTVQCVTGHFNSITNESEIVTLKVQGISFMFYIVH